MCDLTSQKVASTDEAKELADSLNMRLFETSAKNAHNVEEARMLTRQTADTTNGQDLSYRLKVNEFADLVCAKPWMEEVLSLDRRTTQTVSFEEEYGSQTAQHHRTTTDRRDHVRNYTRKPEARKQELAL